MVKQVKLRSIKGFRPIPSKVKKLQEDLAKLDAQYLTNYPKPMSRTTYLKKRNILRKRFNELKNTLRWINTNQRLIESYEVKSQFLPPLK